MMSFANDEIGRVATQIWRERQKAGLPDDPKADWYKARSLMGLSDEKIGYMAYFLSKKRLGRSGPSDRENDWLQAESEIIWEYLHRVRLEKLQKKQELLTIQSA